MNEETGEKLLIPFRELYPGSITGSVVNMILQHLAGYCCKCKVLDMFKWLSLQTFLIN